MKKKKKKRLTAAPLSSFFSSSDNVYRKCLANGTWALKGNYSMCKAILHEEVRPSYVCVCVCVCVCVSWLTRRFHIEPSEHETYINQKKKQKKKPNNKRRGWQQVTPGLFIVNMDRGLVRSPAAVTGRYSQTNAKNTPNVLWNASRASLERSTMNVLRIKSGLNVVSAKDFMCVCVCVCVCVCGCLAVFFFFLEGGSLKSADQTCSYSLFSFGKFLKKETVTVISPNSAAHHLPLPPERWERLVEAERKREREKKKKEKQPVRFG